MSIIQFVEFSLTKCQNVYADTICGATPTSPCYNSYQTCQKKTSFLEREVKFSFHSANFSNVRFGDSLPLLDGFIAPNGTHIYPGINFGSRQSAEINLLEILYTGSIFDPYITDRTFDDSPRFFARFLKIFNCLNKTITIKTGDYENGVLTIHTTQNFIIRQIEKTPTGYRILGSDILSKIESELANPSISLLAQVDDSGVVIAEGLPIGGWNDPQTGDLETLKANILVLGDLSEIPATGGYIRIDEEIFIYEAHSNNVFWKIYKVKYGGTPILHEVEAMITYLHSFGRNPNITKEYANLNLLKTPIDMVYDLLLLANIDEKFIDRDSFDTANAIIHEQELFQFGLAEDMTIEELINEIIQTHLLALFFCEIRQKIVVQVITNNFGTSIPYLYDEKNYKNLSYSVDMEQQITRVSMFYQKDDLTRSYDDSNAYSRNYTYVDSELEHHLNFDTQKLKVVFMRFIPSNPTYDMESFVVSIAKRFILKDGKGTHRVRLELSHLELGKIKAGDLVEIKAKDFSNADGVPQNLLVYIDETSMIDPANISISGFVAEYGLGKRYFIISNDDFSASYEQAHINDKRQYGFLDRDYEICSDI